MTKLLSSAEVLTEVQHFLSEHVFTEKTALPGNVLVDDQDVADLLDFLEKKYKIPHDIEDYPQVHNVGEVISYVISEVNKGR